MPSRRVVRVKSCKSSKKQECFKAKKGFVLVRKSSLSRKSSKRRVRSRPIKRRSKPRRSARRSARRSTRRSTRRSAKKPHRRSSSGYKGFFLSKSKDIPSQIKNFFKIDQEIIYIIKHPKKAKRKNVLKLLAMILLFLMLLCAILKMTGFTYCETIIEKLKALVDSIKNSALNPINALTQVRTHLSALWNKVKNIAPVAAALSLSGKTQKDANELFISPVESDNEDVELETEPKNVDLAEMIQLGYNVGQIKKALKGVQLTVFKKFVENGNWTEYYIPTKKDLAFLFEEI